MKQQLANEKTDIRSADDAKAFVMKLPIQRWPKIPRAYGVTKYDLLAENLVETATVYNVRELDCQVVERVFGMPVKFENGAAQWEGTRVLQFDLPGRTKAFRLLAKMWKAHGVLRIFPDCADHMRKLTAAIQSVEEAFLGSSDRLDEITTQAADLLSNSSKPLSKPHGASIPPFYTQSGYTFKGVEALTPRPWPKGY